MNTDIRIAIGFWDHPKTKRLIRACGYEGAACLQRLWMWAAQNRPNGSLHGMDDVDIELAAGWSGEDGKFFNSIFGRWVDGEGDSYCLHEWMMHNPWACGAENRECKGRFNRMKETHKEIYTILEAAGVTSITKDFYTKLIAVYRTVDEIKAMIRSEYPSLFMPKNNNKPPSKPKANLEGELKGEDKDTLGKNEADLKDTLSDPQADLKQTLRNPQANLKDTLSWALRSAQAQSPSPSPMPFPAPVLLEKPLKGIKSHMSQPHENEPEKPAEDMPTDPEPTKPPRKKREKPTFDVDSFEFKAAAYLLEGIKLRLPDLKQPDLQEWASHIDLMKRIDGRTEDGIRKVLQKLHDPGYWYTKNVLCGRKLREKFDNVMSDIVSDATRTANGGKQRPSQLELRIQRQDEQMKRLMADGSENYGLE